MPTSLGWWIDVAFGGKQISSMFGWSEILSCELAISTLWATLSLVKVNIKVRNISCTYPSNNWVFDHTFLLWKYLHAVYVLLNSVGFLDKPIVDIGTFLLSSDLAQIYAVIRSLVFIFLFLLGIIFIFVKFKLEFLYSFSLNSSFFINQSNQSKYQTWVTNILTNFSCDDPT